MKTLDIATYLSILDSPAHFDMRLLPDNIKDKINKKFDILSENSFLQVIKKKILTETLTT